MSLVKIVETKVAELEAKYSDLFEDMSVDVRSGCSFMLFALQSIFRDEDIYSLEEGIIDSSYRKEKHDYGLDAIYVTSRKSFLYSVEEINDFNEDSKFTIHILQFKKGKGLDQSSLLKFKEGINEIIIKETQKEDNNKYLFDLMSNVNEIKTYLYENFPAEQITIKFYLVFSGIENNVLKDDLIVKQIEDIKDMLSENGYINNQFEIIDAKKLVELHKKGDEIVDVLKYEKTFKYITQTDSNEKFNGYISIIDGHEIARIVKKYGTSLFEANIRDYYRRSDLNSKILATSADTEEAKYFWSFNNGLTLTCRKVDELPNDKYKLYGIQIVNGCQTSNSLYYAYLNKEKFKLLEEKQDNSRLNKKETNELEKLRNKTLNHETSVLTKIIETSDGDLIYRITETTNSQTPIKTFSLKANDNIQHHIEEFLLEYGIHYERRINYYKNQGKRNIVGIQKLFQLFMSQVIIMPSQVKTSPKRLFDSHYEKAFPLMDNEENKIDYLMYLVPIKVDQAVSKKVRQVQRSKSEVNLYRMTLLSNGKLHMGCFILHLILESKYNKRGIIINADKIIDILETDYKFDRFFEKALDNFEKVMKSFVGSRKESIPPAVRKPKLDETMRRFFKKK